MQYAAPRRPRQYVRLSVCLVSASNSETKIIENIKLREVSPYHQ